MGTLRSNTLAPQGLTLNGVTLGEPSGTYTEEGDLTPPYLWDDGAFPSGEASVVAGELVVVVDEEETL